jgi:hypothetical protein
MSRRSWAIGTATALACIGAAVAPSAAVAAPPDCTVDLALPARVTLDAPRTTVPVELTSSPRGCVASASYAVQFEGRTIGTLALDGSGSDSLDVPTVRGSGSYTAVLIGGADTAGDRVSGRDAGPLVAKPAAEADITSASRSGGRVTLSVHVGVYNVDFGDYDDAAATEVALQVATATGWRTVRTVTTNRSGDATATVAAPAGATARWRAVAAETDEHWSRTSATTRR